MEESNSAERVKWVRIASFADGGSAHVARLQLDAEAIPTYLDNEHSAAMLWHIQPAVGGVRLCVPEEYVEQARETLQRPEEVAAEEQIAEDTSVETSGPLGYASLDRCPKCQSMDTEKLSWGRRVMQTAIVLLAGMFLLNHPLTMLLVVGYAVYFLVTKPSHCCLRCRHRWTARAQG